MKFLDDKLEKERLYWQQKLSDALSVASLPADFTRSGAPSATRAAVVRELDEQTTRRLLAVCNGNEELIFTLLVAAVKICLYKYSGNGDVMLLTAIHEQFGRVASLNKALALRDQLSDEMTVRELLSNVKRTLTEAYVHQKYPFERVLELLAQTAADTSSLFRVAALFENFNKSENISHLDTDLTLKFSLSDARLSTSVAYQAGLFKKETVELFVERCERMLRSVVNNPDAGIGELELSDEVERRRLLFEFNDTRRAYAGEECVHQLFEEQAAQIPEAAAVICGGEQLSYGELNRRANRLARRLQGLGVAPEVRVGICAERSIELIVALLGVLKAGGAYVPLDAEWPRERIAFLVEDAGVSVLLRQEHLLNDLAVQGVEVLNLESAAGSTSVEDDVNVASGVGAQNLAYVIYTSGSTGVPKGVAVEHRQLLNYIRGAQERLELFGGLNYAMTSTFAADLGNTVVYPSLCGGGCLHVIAKEVSFDSRAWSEYTAQHRIDCLKIVPSHFAALVQSSRAASAMPRRSLILGGEPSRWEWIEELRSLAPECVIHNHYGPTETTVGVLTYRVEENDGKRPGGYLPLSRPLANSQVYILDKRLRPVATGVPGEVYIGGRGIARGYLGRAPLTAERFLPDPFSTETGARIYRTGDLARFTNADGHLEFLGRLDDQLKIRGYRIELGEIESTLCKHPRVREAIVTAREDARGEKRLVAYVVCRRQPAPDARELRSFLLQTLPDYMIPASIVQLKKMPLMLNGKINRHALPPPEQTASQTDAGTSPHTIGQEIISGIWSEVLGLQQISIEDNFFELGGHSLLATQVISRVREAFGIEVPLRALFEHPSVSALSSHLDSLLSSSQSLNLTPAPPLVPRSAAVDAAPLSFAQQRLWFIDQLEPLSPLYNVPVALRLSGRLDITALTRTLSEIVRRHEVLRTSFSSVSGEPVQIIHQPSAVDIPITDLSHLSAEEREREAERIATAEARRGFDLSTAPLLRAGLIRLSAEEHVLMVTMHHIVTDGWSMGVLVREVAALYEAYSKGEESQLPELKVQYADYASWQRSWLQGEVLERELQYWREQLADAPGLLELPTDRARPKVESGRGAAIRFELGAELSASLRHLSRREGVTLFMTLLAAFKILLSRYSGQEDISIGTPIAGRNHAGTEELIGFFVNTLVLRNRVNSELSFRGMLKQVRETILGAYAHQNLPFELLVEELVPNRVLGTHPLFQVMFVLQNTPQPALKLPELDLDRMSIESELAKFDLLLAMADTDAGISGIIEYKADLFDDLTITRMGERFRKLLESIAADAEQPLANLRLLDEAETGGYSPNDFPEAELSQKEFENLLLEINRASVI